MTFFTVSLLLIYNSIKLCQSILCFPFSGVTDSPRYDTPDALHRAFDSSDTQPDLVREASGTYGSKQQGEYTPDDYYALPDDLRVELIDGVFYKMSSPTTIHQLIISLIWKDLWDYIEEKKGGCLPFASPVDVRLDRDDRTILQPDVLIVCDRNKIIRRCIYGAPDLIAEVLSPATRKKGFLFKAAKICQRRRIRVPAHRPRPEKEPYIRPGP